jgi:hypothetical protein
MELIEQFEKCLDKKKIDKKVMVYFLIVFVDFIRKFGYEIIYVGNKNGFRR